MEQDIAQTILTMLHEMNSKVDNVSAKVDVSFKSLNDKIDNAFNVLNKRIDKVEVSLN